MKKMFIAISIVVYIIVFQSCTTKLDETTKISDYGKWGETTTKILSENFINILPDTDTVDKYGKMYYYKHSQSVLGDYNFVICIELQFDDKISYESELNRYVEDFQNLESKDDISYYYTQDFPENKIEYMDEKIYDGMFYNFEIVFANQSEYTICFVYAQVWDYYKDQVLVEYLDKIKNIGLQ